MHDLDLKDPKQIYPQISQEVTTMLEKLNTPLSDPKLEEARTKAFAGLMEVQTDLKRREAELEKNAEWDTFTIAFYGETNAGKSTIIETLRIALHEKTKEEERKKYRSLESALGLDETKIEALQQSIAVADATLSGNEGQIEELKRQIANKKKEAPFLQKLIFLFKKLPEEKELQDLKKELGEARRKKEKSEREFARLKGDLSKLEALADGGIVGDGRSDFTKITRRFDFDHDGRQFALLDVPGIEGKESDVLAEIWKAVQKAHAVFYVTGKAAPPQTGDNDNPRKQSVGTLEKIKQHLGAQTEVWTIFNKRITNPLPLTKSALLNEDEQGGLNALDEAMREQLGKHYREVFPLSAYPAFLAVADHLPPGSDKLRNRKKFLEKFDTEKILGKSLVSQFLTRIYKLASDGPAKIRHSNFNKANAILIGVTDNVEAYAKSFQEQHEKISQTTKGAQSQLQSSLAALNSRLVSLSDTLANELESSARQEIYRRIESDISNDAFKTFLERIVESKISELEKVFPTKISQEINAFQGEVSETIEDFKGHLEDLQEVFAMAKSGGIGETIEIKLDFKSGISWVGLATSLGGVGAAVVATLAASGVGWVALGIAGILASLVGAWKAFRSLISSKYKMEQQRKAADNNLNDIARQVEENLTNSINKIRPSLEQVVNSIATSMETPVRQAHTAHEVLKQSVSSLKKLSRQIDSVIAA